MPRFHPLLEHKSSIANGCAMKHLVLQYSVCWSRSIDAAYSWACMHTPHSGSVNWYSDKEVELGRGFVMHLNGRQPHKWKSWYPKADHFY